MPDRVSETGVAAQSYDFRSYEDGLSFFRRRGWTDGHPVVLPTEASVSDWLDELGADPTAVVGSSDQRNRTIRVEHVVINSIMAGCRVEYVPVVIAALQSILADGFEHNHLASLGGPWPFFLVGGPIVDEIGLNYDQYTMGPGHHANSTIARAVSLVMWNCMEARVDGIQRGAYGPAWRNESLVVERPDSPWPLLHENRGFDADDSVVTSFPATDFEQVLVHLLDSPEHILAPIIDSLANGRFVWGPYVIVLPPNMVSVFDERGWTKKDVEEYIIDNTSRSIAGLKRRTRWAEQQAGRRPWKELLEVSEGDEEEMIPLFIRRPEYYDIAFRDKFLDSRDSDVMVVNSGGDSGPCAYILIPYTETGPVPMSIKVEALGDGTSTGDRT